MKLIIIFLFSVFVNSSQASGLDKVRSLFFKIEESKENAIELKRITEDGIKSGNTLFLGYHAVATANLASYTLLPISKYNYFRQGRDMIERAINQMPENAELRFLRLTIQIGTPVFLKYDQHIVADREFILTHIESEVNRRRSEQRFWFMVLVYLRDRSRPDQASLARILKLIEQNS